MEEKKIFINGLKINYKIAGQNSPILILHGWGGSSDSWVEVGKILAKEKFKVIIPDLPGFGKSETPPRPWSITDYAKWTIDFVSSQNLKEISLLGHSFGGRIAIKLTTQYSEMIKKLILCSAAGIKLEPEFETKIIFWLAKIGNAIFAPKPLKRLKDFARNFFYIFLRHKDYVKADGTMRETIKKVLEEDLLPDLPKIKAKTLIIWGEKDKIVPIKYAYIFKEKIKDSKLEVIPKVGHAPNLEVSVKLAQVIINFLKTNFCLLVE